MATFGYGRVSTLEQNSENQRLEIEQAGHRIEYWFADEGVSGKGSVRRWSYPSSTGWGGMRWISA
jgi:DNA invertase Pin-like site-specific DNA recombinase